MIVKNLKYLEIKNEGQSALPAEIYPTSSYKNLEILSYPSKNMPVLLSCSWNNTSTGTVA